MSRRRTERGCPICGSDKWKYVSFSEECWGTVEQHGYCDQCGYKVEQCYSDTIAGFVFDRKRGFKVDGKWYGKNTRKRKRMRRKYNIKHAPNDLWLDLI